MTQQTFRHPRRPEIGDELRFEIKKRDGFACVYCGYSKAIGQADGTWGATNWLEIDHIKAKAEGGGDHPGNLATACQRCNGGKGARSLLVRVFPLLAGLKREVRVRRRIIRLLEETQRLQHEIEKLKGGLR